MEQTHLLALDLGTTGVRAVLFDAEGRAVASRYARLRVVTPAPDRVEQDAQEFLDRSVEVMTAVLTAGGVEAGAVRAVGLVCQRSSAVAWDARSGRALAPVIGWQDRRTLARVRALRDQGIPVNTLAACTKFEWLISEVPAVREAAAAGRLCLGTPDAWLTWHLSAGDAMVTDASNAGTTGLFDAAAGDWLEGALALFGQDRRWHPEVVATNAVVAETAPRWLGTAVPLAARAGDQQAACFAQGVRRSGDAKVTLGTSAMLDRCTGDVPEQPPEGAYALPLWSLATATGREEGFCTEGTVVTAGAAVEWLVRVGLLPSVERLDALAAAGTADALRFVPALAGLGTPWMADAARGRFDGLGLGTRREDLVRAVVDGIAHRIADVADALDVADSLAVDGGLARSEVLLQRLADLAGRRLRVAAEVETTARGAAALAASTPELVGAPLPEPRPARVVEPQLDAAMRSRERGAWRAAVSELVGPEPG